MTIEAEVVPLMIMGVLGVSIMELVFGYITLKNKSKDAFKALIGHIVSTLAAFCFLFSSLFGLNLFSANNTYRIASIDNSFNLGIFGILWFISVCFVIRLITVLTEGGDKN